MANKKVTDFFFANPLDREVSFHGKFERNEIRLRSGSFRFGSRRGAFWLPWPEVLSPERLAATLPAGAGR